MKLIDPETNQEYEFAKEPGVSALMPEKGVPYGTLKPVDSWPKAGKFYYLDQYGDPFYSEKFDEEYDTSEYTGIYRTREEAEYARDRIKSLQEAKVVMGLVIGEEVSVTLILPKKYLKAWEAKQDA